VTVAVIQALARWSPAAVEEFLGRFGIIILDEVHHVAASIFRDVVGRCPARYRLGLTATPEREDGLTPLLELYFGPPVARVSHGELVAAGVLVLPEIRSIATAFIYPYCGADDYASMLAALVTDDARNALVVSTVVPEASKGYSCLVLSGRIDHCELLVERLRAVGVTAALLAGPVQKDRRRRVLDDARAGRLAVVVATSLADEGLDLPRLSRVFLVYPGRARGRTVQRLGRVMRPHPEKTGAILFDFVDRCVPILRRHHLERRRLYAEVLGVPASRLSVPQPTKD
jgi:superfamily II DNA or RNA helicase